ncbi:efflux RND transporter periplasmic adaptor subunit [Candidatus Laterigemmans baculatus]|uniref:efflux RND transporter periplasmic adaptor subunit n=1 Tax=Candidatus Laterigemmans baculatus TaxID=2770505 RepID=UPI0013DCC780|nr:HlyD family efflux transporter periplasmic adaptor subunit [Candidatus Laterigemmans baculatus]
MVILINNVRVPAQVEGVLTAIGVEEGDLVEAGQTLAVIDDQKAQLTLLLTMAQEKEAELNALNTINRRDAEQSEELAREEAVAYADLARQGATPTWEARAKALEANRAKLRIELAELNERIAQAQYMAKKSERELAELEVARRKITAPFGGFVELRVAQLGEWVQPGSPIVQLVQMDRLRAQGAVSAVDPDSLVTPGMPAVVEFNLGGGRTERINGVVGFVGNDVDISNRRRVWVEFENKRVGDDWLIKPGMVPVIRIDNSRIPEPNVGQAAAAGNANR